MFLFPAGCREFSIEIVGAKSGQLAITGWVHNLPNGSIEAIFADSDGAAVKIIGWCHKGSLRAKVTNVEATVANSYALNENFSDFKITTYL